MHRDGQPKGHLYARYRYGHMFFRGFCATRRQALGDLICRQSGTIIVVASTWWQLMPLIKNSRIRLETRLPVDVRDWLASRAQHFSTSINAQIIAAVRSEMEREQALERK